MKTLVNRQSLRTRTVASEVASRELHHCLMQLCMCVCAKKICKENNERKEKIIRDDLGNGGKNRTIVCAYVFYELPLVLLLLEARRHPIQFVIVNLCLGVACTCLQAALAETCYF